MLSTLRVITIADRAKLEAVTERDLGAQNTRARGLKPRSYRDRVKRT